MWLARRNSLIGYAAAVALLVVAMSPAVAQAQPLIAEIVVRGVTYTSASTILDELRAKDILKIGEPYTDQKRQVAEKALMDLGYYDTVSLSYEQVGEDVKVIITVVEKRRIEQIVFVGNTVVTDEELKETIISKIGEVVVSAPTRTDVDKIQGYYRDRGYMAIVPDVTIDDYNVLTFVINESHVEDILVEGLEKTQEWVVRRQIKTQVGELFQEQKITQDLNRILNMGIFSDVRVDSRPGQREPEKAVIVVIQIEEKRTGMITVAAAYSELDDFVAMLSVAQNNLRGRAERASLDVELFGRTSFDFKFFEPYLDAKDTELNLRLFDTERQRRFVGGAAVSLAEDEFEERRTGAIIGVARPMTETQKISLGLRTEKISASFLQGTRQLNLASSGVGTSAAPAANWSGPGGGQGPIIVAAPLHPGGRVNSLTLGWHSDTRDLRADPRQGQYQGITAELAGARLGGESTYQQFRWDHRRYFALRGGRDVLALRLLLGTTTGTIPLFDSFSIGGATSLRGYEQDRYRGEKMVLCNAEYRYGLSKNLILVGFVDAGDAYGGSFQTIVPGFTITADDQDLDLHVGVGFGIRAVTPLGPLRLDFGFGEYGSQTHFGFGHTF